MASAWTDLQASNPGDVGYGGTNVDVWTLAGTAAAPSGQSVENLFESNLLFSSAEAFGPGVPAFITGAIADNTFSNVADRQVAMNVTGNGNDSADWSTPADGKVASSLLVTNPGGQSTSATGNAASLDTDSSLQPSLSVDAANPAHVTFTVSGLEPDYSGTVTFTDASGTQDVVPIELNGAYSTNLSNLKSGTITYLLSVSDPAGNVINVDPPLNLGDGSANAPAGAPQLPNLLSGYAAQPSWNVAGVDYAVGIPSGTVLKDPSTISMPGVSVDLADHVINVSGSNVTLNGYDFSGDGGWEVSVNSGSNITIENCNFAVGSNDNSPIYVTSAASNVTIIDNIINGAGSGSGAQMLIAGDGAGTTTIEYNLIENAWGEDIVLSSDVGGENWVVQYNVIENAGEGFNSGAHGDWIQTYNAPGANTNSFECNFNTFVQDIPIAEGRTQGISAFSANSGSNAGGVQTKSFNNNTFVATSGAYVNYAIILDTTRLIGTATIENNYFDTSGIGGANGGGGNWDFVGVYNGSNDGPYNGTVTIYNNINMVTGAYLSPNVSSGSPPVAPGLRNEVHNAVVARIDNYLAGLVDSYIEIENDVHGAIVSAVTSYENDVREVHNAIVAAETSYESDVREVHNAIVGAVTRYENEVHNALVGAETSYENDVHEVHNAIVGAVTSYENEVHEAQNAIVAGLTSYIASSFPEGGVSHVANSVSDASQAGNQSLLTNPHHA